MNLFDRTQDITIKRTENHLGGFVYVVKLDNRIKIGRAVNPKVRTRTIETSSGLVAEKIFITNKIYNSHEIERRALKHTRKEDSLGEWRDSDFEETIDYIMSLNLEYSTLEEDKYRETEMVKGTKKFIASFRKTFEEKAEVDYSVHCKYCCIPIEQYTPSDYASDVGCELYYIFHGIIDNCEDAKMKICYSQLKIQFVEEINSRKINVEDIDLDIVLQRYIESYDETIGMTVLTNVEQLINFIPSLNKKED